MFSSLFKRPMALPSWRGLRTAFVLSSAALGPAAPVLAQSAWSSYQANPNAHPNIPNASYAGYYYGERELPKTSDNRLPDGTVLPVINVKTSFGAQGNGTTDDTQAIKNAIAAVGGTSYPNGAVLYFPNGTYILSGQLNITTSKTILRGESRAGTIFRFTKSLEELFPTAAGSTKPWGYSGGLITFQKSWTDSFPAFSFVTYPNRGATTLNITGAGNWAVGDFMKIVVKDVVGGTGLARHLLGDGTWADGWFNDSTSASNSSSITGDGHAVSQFVEVVGVNASANTVTLKQPLRFDLRSTWGNITLRKPSGVMRDVGLESLTLSMARPYEWLPDRHLKEDGWNGVTISGVRDGFVRDVKIVDIDGLALLISNSKGVTATGIDVTASSPQRARHHHAFALGFFTQDCLVEKFNISSWPMHGLNLDQWASGNVYSEGTMAHGTFDYHTKLPFDNIITQIEMVNDGQNSGPGGGGPQMGTRNAHWNINGKATGNAMVLEPPKMARGALVGVYGLPLPPASHPVYGASQTLIESSGYAAGMAPNPGNLYQAQKALRLGQSIPGAGATGYNPSYTVRPYDFEFSSGVINNEIMGQDNWTLWEAWASDTAKIGVPMGRLVTDSTHPLFPNGTRALTSATSGSDARVQRRNNWGWHFIPFQGNETNGTIEFDMKDKAALGVGGIGDSIKFGIGFNGFYLADAVSVNASLPSTVASTDWLRLRLVIDFTANTGQGSASLFYRNLTDGETAFTPVAGIQNINLSNKVRQAYTWDSVTANVFSTTSRIDHILVNGSTNGTVVNASPTVSLTAPTNNSTYIALASFTLTASASDPDGSITKVEFFHGSAKIGEDGSSPYSFAVNHVTGGSYSFTAKATSNNGVTVTSSPVNVVVNAVAGTGLKGEYFSGTTFSTLVTTQTDAKVDFNWGTGSPAKTDGTTMSSVGPDYFSVRWTGQIQAIEGGSYNISVVADDTAKVWINDLAGTPVINQTTYNSGTATNGTFTMMPGQKYNIKIDFTEAAGGAMMQLKWTRPGGTSMIVPQSQLFPTLGLVDRTLESGGSMLARGENVTGGQTRDKAFDNSTSTKWLDYASATWIQYKFANEASRTITSYTITSGDDMPERDPKNWTLQGSPDGSVFTNLHSGTNESFSLRKQTRTFSFTNSTGYKYYRLNITSNTSGGITQLSEIRLLEP